MARPLHQRKASDGRVGRRRGDIRREHQGDHVSRKRSGHRAANRLAGAALPFVLGSTFLAVFYGYRRLRHETGPVDHRFQ